MKKSRLAILAALLFAVGAFVVAHDGGSATVVSLPAGVAPSPALVDSARLFDDVRTLASVPFDGRRTGTSGSHKARAYLQERFTQLGLTPFGAAYAQPFSFTVTSLKGLFTPGRPFRTSYNDAANYVGFIKGSGVPERFIVVSAHYDHLGSKGGQLYPGADDNASGVAAMLAVAAYFKAHPPTHTIVFAAFDGEEIGLQGAKAFMGALPFAKAQLALNLNFDMVSHNERNEIFAAGTSYTAALAPLVAEAARRHTVNVKLGHDHGQLLPGAVSEDWTDSSDHGPFHDAGVPFLYFGVEDHGDYHQPGDTFEHINQPFFNAVANLLVDVAATADRTLK
ncbi:M20/M25/M40 family metallo-hydrolase [Massilia sp. DWR3-1-1]|uniref:M20/M25/M40 family metallo-hydrolase n=1 Tax=Massilia sp. DWR3-1-1 TaxID=2804559 RepID=UPI003CF440E3